MKEYNLKNYYLKLDENTKQLEEKGKIYTHGIGSNGIGGEYVNLQNVINNLINLVIDYQKDSILIDELFNNYTENKIKIEELEKIQDNRYKSYYNGVYAILTKNEVEKIQKEINFNFMSLSFTARLTNTLKYEKLGKV